MYDLVLLSECWMDTQFEYETDDFICKSFPRQKSKCIQGGCVFIMIRNVYSEYVTIYESIADTFVWMKFSKEFICLNDDLYICCVSSHKAVQIIMCYMIAIFLDYLKTV